MGQDWRAVEGVGLFLRREVDGCVLYLSRFIFLTIYSRPAIYVSLT